MPYSFCPLSCIALKAKQKRVGSGSDEEEREKKKKRVWTTLQFRPGDAEEDFLVLKNLEPLTRYEVRIMADNYAGASPFCDPMDFMTAEPFAIYWDRFGASKAVKFVSDTKFTSAKRSRGTVLANYTIKAAEWKVFEWEFSFSLSLSLSLSHSIFFLRRVKIVKYSSLTTIGFIKAPRRTFMSNLNILLGSANVTYKEGTDEDTKEMEESSGSSGGKAMNCLCGGKLAGVDGDNPKTFKGRKNVSCTLCHTPASGIMWHCPAGKKPQHPGASYLELCSKCSQTKVPTFPHLSHTTRKQTNKQKTARFTRPHVTQIKIIQIQAKRVRTR